MMDKLKLCAPTYVQLLRFMAHLGIMGVQQLPPSNKQLVQPTLTVNRIIIVINMVAEGGSNK